VGNITQSLLDTDLWVRTRDAIRADYASLPSPGAGTVTFDADSVTTQGVSIDGGAGTFALRVERLPYYITTPTDERYRRYIRVTSTGTYGESTRTVSMDFVVDKRVKFAVVGKVPIQVGRNTLIEGPVAMATANKLPPVLALSDFRHLTASLKTSIDAFDAFVKVNHNGYDNRISVHHATESAAAIAAGYTDRNKDNFIDEYDLFLKEFDDNDDKAVSTEEFTDSATDKLYDANLFASIDALGGPQFDGDLEREGLEDGVIDNRDVYAKVNGQLTMAVTSQYWAAHQTIEDQINGPIVWNDPTTPAIRFGADTGTDIFDLSPANFDTTSFKDRTGADNGTPSKVGTVFTNWTVTAADKTHGNADERTPFGSTSYQATYRRPVFRGVTFRNCRIPKGLNALFEDCTFEGATFVELTSNITNGGSTTTDPGHGMTWSKRMESGHTFNKSTALTSSTSKGFKDGNNLRFNGCVFKGPVASDVPTAYTHFSNSWEFTGATKFAIVEDEEWKKTATIVAPQTNIEMGSFTDPTAAPSTLVGVVVAGNIDIRGTSVVDGSVIVTGDGAGHTTLGWFGASDSSTDPSAMPEGGYGRLSIRYNPYRALPDGIDLPIDILPDGESYTEGQ
ncbi:MAG: hypothetical protein ACREIT_10910, partial [Tepidisphaeraceae bacterium]